MPSAEKLAANRSNAQRSTGPTTEAGKKAASRNATRHGLTDKHIVIQGENPEAYEALRRFVSQKAGKPKSPHRLICRKSTSAFIRCH